jgi:hypothetical protein
MSQIYLPLQKGGHIWDIIEDIIENLYDLMLLFIDQQRILDLQIKLEKV